MIRKTGLEPVFSWPGILSSERFVSPRPGSPSVRAEPLSDQNQIVPMDQLRVVEDVEDDDVVPLLPEVREAADDLLGVVQQVGEYVIRYDPPSRSRFFR